MGNKKQKPEKKLGCLKVSVDVSVNEKMLQVDMVSLKVFDDLL